MSSSAADEAESTAREPDTNGGSEFSIGRSNALIPLLAIFAATVAMVLIVIVRAKPVAPPHGALADKAFGPADFPAVFGRNHEVALPDLPVGSGMQPEFPLPAPPFTEGIFPCSNCHAGMEPNAERRPLEALHSDIVLRHDEEHRWCLDCHDAGDRDQLRLASGVQVPFTESYRLCGQCHGTQFRDWKSGIHGKRVGFWNGRKQYFLCVHCHDPHSPRFAALAPLPPPVRPQFLRPEDAAPPQAAAPAGAPREKQAAAEPRAAAVDEEPAHGAHAR